MKAIAVILVCMVAGCAAQCSTIQRLLVKKEWSKLFGTGLNREAFATKIWKSMYKVKPDTSKFFTRVDGDNIYSPKFIAHSQRVLGGLDICFSLLDDPPTLDAQLAQLKSQHIPRGVTEEYFKILHEVILDVMPDYMGDNYHNYQAWVDCLGVIRTGIVSLV